MGGSGGSTGSSNGSMSGGPGGGGFGGGSSAGGPAGTDCSKLIFDTVLGSPDPAVVGTLTNGDICNLSLLTNPLRIAAVTKKAGDYVGAITTRWEDLLGCIDQGVTFEAVILDTSSPVRVRVRPAP